MDLSHHISLSGDIKLYLGPKQDIHQCFPVCHWNLNNAASPTISKIQSLIASNCIDKFDIIYLSESYINSEILSSDSKLQNPVIILLRWIILQIQNTEICAFTTNVHCL